MPIKLQEKLIQWILQPLFRISEAVPQRIRDVSVSLGVLVIILMEFARKSGLYTGRFLYVYLIAYLLFGMMIFAGLTSELKPVRFSPVLTVCWLIVVACMLVTGILVNIDVLADGVLWLGILPVLYLVWSGQHFLHIVPLVIRGVLLSFLVFSVISIFFFPIDDVNYGSFFLNRNGTSLYLVAVFACVFIYILSAEKYSFRLFLADLLLGFVSATIYYTNCRTGMLSAALCFVFSGMFQLFLCRENWRRVLLRNLLPAVAAIALLTPLTIYIYQGGYQLKTAIQTAMTEFSAVSTPAEPAPVEPAPVAPTPADPAPVVPPSKVLDTMKDYNDQRFDTSEKSLNDYTAGRAELWRIHLEKVGLLGNPADTVLYKANGDIEGRSSHFTIIQFAYSYGVFAGVFFLALNLLAGLASIRYAVKRRNLKYSLYPFAVAIAFGANSVMEAIGHPAENALDLLYFLSLIPLVTRPLTDEKRESTAKTKSVLYVVHDNIGRVTSGSGVRPTAMYQAFLDRGWEVHLLSGYCGRGEGKQRRAEVRKAMAWMRENRPAFCYIESSTYPIMYHCDYALIRLLRREGIPTAYFYRDCYRRFPGIFPRRKGFVNSLKECYLDFLQWRTDRVLRNVDIVYFPCEGFFQYFSYRDMRALPPAGELTGASPDDAFPPEGPKTSLYVGGVSEQYGTSILLKAFDLLNQDSLRYPLILVCREEEFERTFSDYNIPSWLELRHTSGKELEPLYARASLALHMLPKNEYTDMAVGVKLFQYVSYGLPLLFTENTAMKKLIEENGLGRTAPHNAQAFAAAVKALLDDPEALRAYRRQGLASLAEKHLWVHRVDQIARDLLGDEGNSLSENSRSKKG